MKKLLILLAVLAASSLAEAYVTVFNPFTGKLDYVSSTTAGGGGGVNVASAPIVLSGTTISFDPQIAVSSSVALGFPAMTAGLMVRKPDSHLGVGGFVASTGTPAYLTGLEGYAAPANAGIGSAYGLVGLSNGTAGQKVGGFLYASGSGRNVGAYLQGDGVNNYSLVTTGGQALFQSSVTITNGLAVSTIAVTSSGAGEIDFTEGISPAGSASTDVIWGDSADNWLKFIPNNTTDYLVVGSSASVAIGNCAKFSANGSIVDAGATCGTGSGSGSGSTIYSATATASFPFGFTVTTVTATSSGGLRIANNDGELDFYNTANNSVQAFIESINASSLKIYESGALPIDLFTNDILRMRVGGTGAVAMSSNTIMSGATFYYNAPIRMGGNSAGANSLFINGGNSTTVGSNLMIGVANSLVGTNLTTGNSNTCVGSLTCQNATTDTNLTAFGTNAAKVSSGTSNVTAIGGGSLFSNVSGISNTAIGKNAHVRNVSGNGNTSLGDGACDNDGLVSSTTANGQICLGAGSFANAPNVMAIGSPAYPINDVYMNSFSQVVVANGSSVTFHSQSSSGTNTTGGDFVIAGGQGRGTGTGGSVIVQVAPPGSTGNVSNSLVTAATFASDKSVSFANDSFGLTGMTVNSSATFVRNVTISSGAVIAGNYFPNAAPARMSQDLPYTASSLFINGGSALSSGTNNVMIGVANRSPGSGLLSDSGGNTCIGGSDICANLTHDGSLTAIGNSAAAASSNTTNMTAIGAGSFLSNVSGISNTGIGKNTHVRNVSGNGNTSIGDGACDNQGLASSTTASGQICLGAGSFLESSNAMALGSPSYPITDVYMNSKSQNGFGNVDGTSITFHAQNSTGTNKTGGNFMIAAGQGTGTGTGGDVIIKVSSAGPSGINVNPVYTVATFSNSGITINPTGLSTFTVVGSSITPTPGNLAKWSGSGTIIDGGLDLTGGSGGDSFGSHTATKTVTANFGIVTTTITVSSNTVMSGATFYYNAPVRMGGNLGSTSALYINGGNGTATGANNIMIGVANGTPGASLTTGNLDTCIGANTCSSLWNEVDITAVGESALKVSSGGSYNTAFGRAALFSNTTGGSNTAIGRFAHIRNITGSNNTSLGLNACENDTLTSSTTASGQICIGSSSYLDGSNMMAIGSTAYPVNDVYMNSKAPQTGNTNGLSVVFHAQGSTGTNTTGGNFVVAAGQGTGTGASGAVIVQIATNTASGSGVNSLISVSSWTAKGYTLTTNLHFNTTGSTQPTLSGCGTTPSIIGTDTAFTITGGTGATGCTATFTRPFINTPTCIVSDQSMSVVNALTYTVSATAVTLTQTGMGTSKVDIACIGHD